MKLHSSYLALVGLACLTACGGSSDGPQTPSGTFAMFSPSTGEIPLPSDLLFADSTDGTLNPELASGLAGVPLVEALGALDGWGTSSSLSMVFAGELDPTTVEPGSSVRFFEVSADRSFDSLGGPIDGVARELLGSVQDPDTGLPSDADAEYMALVRPAAEQDAGQSLVVVPLVPLAASTTYMAIVTDALLDTAGEPVTRSIAYQNASQLAPLSPSNPLADVQQQVLAMHAAAQTQDIEPDSIVLSTQFSTQSVDDVFADVAAVLAGNEAAVIAELCSSNPNLICDDTAPDPNGAVSHVISSGPSGTTGDPQFGGSPANAATIHEGALTLPYFLTAATPGGPLNDSPSSDPAPLEMPFRARLAAGLDDVERHLTRFNSLPAITGQQSIPLLVSLPRTLSRPPGGWPVVVFQHGIDGSRADLLALADTLANGGFAAVAIDLPLHGVDPDHPLFTGYLDDGIRERTFGLDLLDNASFEENPDGIPEPTGTHFISLDAPLVCRDNFRQAASDLLALFSQLDSIDIDGDLTPDFNSTDVHFIGHSLGAIAGVPALRFADPVNSVTFGMPGGGLARLLAESPSLGPPIESDLEQAGIDPEAPEFEQFLSSTQAVIDSADPLNHAAALAASGLPIFLIEIVGLEGLNDPDLVLPNSVAGAPLSGTEPLIRAFGLAPVADDQLDPDGIQGAARFTEGGHSSLLVQDSPTEGAFFEMRSMAVEFAATSGTVLTIADDDVVAGGPGAN